MKQGDKLNEGRYLLKRRIGQGGFSVVWLAEDAHNDNMLVAVKVFAPQSGLDEAGLSEFEKEKDMTMSLHDPRLVKAVDYFVENDSPCLIFPYMSKGSLAQKIRNSGPLPEAEVAKLIAQISGVLHYMHTQGQTPVLHLDIKPENILIDSKGDYLLSDFGISLQMRDTLMRNTHVKGDDMIHKAPERILNQPFDAKVDIFAFGVTLYECCAGVIQPGGYIPGFNLAKEIGTLPQLDKAKYTKRLEELIHACMHKDPAQRPTPACLERFALHYLRDQFWPEIACREPATVADTTKKKPWATIALITLPLLALSVYFAVRGGGKEVVAPMPANYEAYEHYGKWGYKSDQGAVIIPANYSQNEAAYQLGMKLKESSRFEEALQCFQNTAQQQYVEAQVELGILYFEGKGTEKNPAEAVKWLKAANLATSNNHLKAHYYLGLIYEQGGPGVEKDLAKAKQHFEYAAKNGDPSAIEKLKSM